MNKTKIEWTDYTWNPVTGCLNGCEYCYARKIAERFKFENGFNPTFYPERMDDPRQAKKPAKIFVCSMADLFGDWVSDDWIRRILNVVQYAYPQHTFQFLTKFPENLSKWNPWPSNAWVGATVTDEQSFIKALTWLPFVKARVAFISIEPFLGPISLRNYEMLCVAGIDWIIIGAQTNPYVPPKTEWARDMVIVAKRAGIPVFLKDTMKRVFGVGAVMQEYPTPKYADYTGT